MKDLALSRFRRVTGKKVLDIDKDDFSSVFTGYEKVILDIGTGDGRYILDTARDNPDCLCIGLDAASDNMRKLSRVASMKPAKGGAENAVYLWGSAENLPDILNERVDHVSVFYPWGSLMRIVSQPNVETLSAIKNVFKRQGELTVLLNYSVFEDADYLERLGMGDIVSPIDNPDFHKTYEEAGFAINQFELFAGDPPIRTMWGRHLVRSSQRKTLLISANTLTSGQ